MSSGIWNCIVQFCVELVTPSKVTLTVSRRHCIVRSVLDLNWWEMYLEGMGKNSVLFGASV